MVGDASSPKASGDRGVIWDEDRAEGWSWKGEGCRESAVLRQERTVGEDE